MPMPSMWQQIYGKEQPQVPKYTAIDPGSNPSVSQPNMRTSSGENDWLSKLLSPLSGLAAGGIASLFQKKPGDPQAAYGGVNSQDRNWQANWAQRESGMPSASIFGPNGLSTGLNMPTNSMMLNKPPMDMNRGQFDFTPPAYESQIQLNKPGVDMNRGQFNFQDIGIIPEAMYSPPPTPTWSSVLGFGSGGLQ